MRQAGSGLLSESLVRSSQPSPNNGRLSNAARTRAGTRSGSDGPAPLFDTTIANVAGAGWDVTFVNTDWVAAAQRVGAVRPLDLIAMIRPMTTAAGHPLLRLEPNGQILGVPTTMVRGLIYRRDLSKAPGARARNG